MERMELQLYRLLRPIMDRMGLRLYRGGCNHGLPGVDWRRSSSSILYQPARFNQERSPIMDWCSSF